MEEHCVGSQGPLRTVVHEEEEEEEEENTRRRKKEKEEEETIATRNSCSTKINVIV
jgi:hypothetical protein